MSEEIIILKKFVIIGSFYLNATVNTNICSFLSNQSKQICSLNKLSLIHIVNKTIIITYTIYDVYF